MHSVLDRTDLLTLSEAARRLPGRPHRSTLWRWSRRGIETSKGRVRLQVLRLGHRVLISPEQIEVFAKALGDADASTYATPTPTPSRNPRRSSRTDQAEQDARRLGI